MHSPSAEFRWRVLSSAFGPGDRPDAGGNVYKLKRERWARWVASAVSAGMFEEPYGTELKSRLTGIDEDGFRSALAECMTCWAFSSELQLQLVPRPSGRGGRVLEFGIRRQEGDVGLEVKSPRFPGFGDGEHQTTLSRNRLHTYLAAVAMRAALRSANRQFVRARRNVLVIGLPEIQPLPSIVPEGWTTALIRAFYGEKRETDMQAGFDTARLVEEGNFLRQLGGSARFTRISAVVGLAEFACGSDLQALVLHNPYSQNPLEASMLGMWTQFMVKNGQVSCVKHDEPVSRSTSSF